MDLSERRCFVAKNRIASSLALLLPVFLALGCVDLTQPESLQKACADRKAGTCVNNYVRPGADASQDATKNPGHDAPSDPSSGNEPGAVKRDEGPDLSPITADASDGLSDTLGTAGGDVRDGQRADTKAVAAEDTSPDKGPGAEPAPERPGAEPLAAPEPAPEPRPEPGVEPRPEPGPEPPRDGGNKIPDGSAAACANAQPVTVSGDGANTGPFNTVGAHCFVTCDNIQFWGCSSFNTEPGDLPTRTVKVNGTAVQCAGALPLKTSGKYYYFEIGPGGQTWDAIWWTGTSAASCPVPPGGFAP